jgi:wyosine [tRNA(Phe)-imidazoG37] synthetase (radical SAM superfamily)
LEIHGDGNVSVCCTARLKPEYKYIGNILKNSLEKLSVLRILELTGQGDPIFNRNISRFLEHLETFDTSRLTIRFITNGQLLNEPRWEKIERLRPKALLISVSIDAASKETYESIRRGAKWKTLIKNMKMLSEKRRNGQLAHLMVTFVVMKKNLHEMIPFIEMAQSWNCDKIEFQRIFGSLAGTQNIFDMEDPESLERLGKIIQDPVFENNSINISSFEQYKDYRATAEKRKSYGNLMIRHYLKKASRLPHRLFQKSH